MEHVVRRVKHFFWGKGGRGDIFLCVLWSEGGKRKDIVLLRDSSMTVLHGPKVLPVSQTLLRRRMSDQATSQLASHPAS